MLPVQSSTNAMSTSWLLRTARSVARISSRRASSRRRRSRSSVTESRMDEAAAALAGRGTDAEEGVTVDRRADSERALDTVPDGITLALPTRTSFLAAASFLSSESSARSAEDSTRAAAAAAERRWESSDNSDGERLLTVPLPYSLSLAAAEEAILFMGGSATAVRRSRSGCMEGRLEEPIVVSVSAVCHESAVRASAVSSAVYPLLPPEEEEEGGRVAGEEVEAALAGERWTESLGGSAAAREESGLVSMRARAAVSMAAEEGRKSGTTG
jgi:hypothetical protein